MISFVREKIIRGRKHRYLVRSIRHGSSVIQKVERYLGPVDPSYKIRRKK